MPPSLPLAADESNPMYFMVWVFLWPAHRAGRMVRPAPACGDLPRSEPLEEAALILALVWPKRHTC